jgi:hypothetical protein
MQMRSTPGRTLLHDHIDRFETLPIPEANAETLVSLSQTIWSGQVNAACLTLSNPLSMAKNVISVEDSPCYTKSMLFM